MVAEYDPYLNNLAKILEVNKKFENKLNLILIDNSSFKGDIESVGFDYLIFISEGGERQIIPFASILRIIKI